MSGDGPLRWLVSSASRPGIEHVVDLGNWNGFGECSCEHFQMRVLPELGRGNPCRRCKHILKARETMSDTFIASLTNRKEEKRDKWHNQ